MKNDMKKKKKRISSINRRDIVDEVYCRQC